MSKEKIHPLPCPVEIRATVEISTHFCRTDVDVAEALRGLVASAAENRRPVRVEILPVRRARD
jgi:hypothetical protein